MLSKRRELDRYLTSEWRAKQLFENVAIRGSVMETCCGEQAITKVMMQESNIGAIYTNDIDPNIYADFHLDASTQDSYLSAAISLNTFPQVDWHITNPPYNVAPKIIPLAFEHARVGIAMLLRLTYLEPVSKSKRKDAIHRGLWLAKHPPTDLIVLPRYSYTGDGKSDSVTSAWMVFDKRRIAEATGNAIVSHVTPNRRYQRILCIPEPERISS